MNLKFADTPARIILLVGIVLFTIISISIYTTEDIIKNLEESMFEEKIKSLNIASSKAEGFFHHLTNILVLTSTDEIVKNVDQVNLITKELKGIPSDADPQKRNLAKKILENDPAFGTVAFVMANGDMYLTEPYSKQENLGQLNWNHRDWYKGTVSSQKPYISEVYNATATRAYAVSVNIPVFTESNELLGLWRSVVDLRELYRHVDHVDSNYLVFFDHKGTELPISLAISDEKGPRNVLDFKSTELSLSGNSGIIKEISNDNEFLVAYAPIEVSSHKWGALLIEPIDVAYADIINIRYELYALTLLISLAVIISGISYYRNSKMRITIQKELEEKILSQQTDLIKAERFSAIGELSARIAHDIRNPLSVIQSSLDLFEHLKDNPEKYKKLLERNARAVERITHQIEEVMDFVRNSKLHVEKIHLKKMFDILISEIENTDEIKINLPKNELEISGDKGKLYALFSNLILNAFQAIEEKGTITISISQLNDVVKIDIEDTGKGVLDADLEKIFEPLYTTKQEGTGLGLASCKKIVESHGGSISVKNNPTTFTVVLPLVVDPVYYS